MANLFPFEVYTPNRVFFSDSVEAVVLTLIDGEAAVYANHTPFSAAVTPCLLKIKGKDGKWKIAFTAEGILEVSSGKTLLISDASEWPEEIDYERAKSAMERAMQTIDLGMLKFETETAGASLKRARMRIRARNEGLTDT